MTKYVSKYTGNHRGGPHPRRLSMAAGAPIRFPNGQRVQGRTLAQAIHRNANLEGTDPMRKIGQSDVVGMRVGRRPPLVAGPARSRRVR